MRRSVAVLGALGALLTLAACYQPDLARCAVTCNDGVTCPDAWTCGSDHYCHADGDSQMCGAPSSGYVQIAAGATHTCAVDVDGALWCWGDNGQYQLGLADVEVTGTPTPLPGLGWTWAASADNHSCAIQDGTMLCWGFNSIGQLGTNDEHHTPTAILGGFTDWFEVDAGAAFTCGLRGTADVGGRVFCWGGDDNGELGDGGADDSGPMPREIGTTEGVDRFADFVEVSASEDHVCARRKGGDAYCWGTDDVGQIGDLGTAPVFAPFKVPGGPYRSVTAGTGFTCAVRASDGTVWCWGDNAVSQLGHPASDVPSSNTPIQVGTSGGWTAVSASKDSACAIQDGAVWCWGRNDDGQDGVGSWGQVPTPTQVDGLAGVTALTGGGFYECALSGGNAYCWGNNDEGQLGNGAWAEKLVPTQVGIASDWQDVDIGGDHTCGIRAGGHLWCWGWNNVEQLGVSGIESSPVPVEVTAADQWRTVEVGDLHTCATRQGASSVDLWCWGNGTWGQVGRPGGGDGPWAPAEIAHKSAGWSALTVGDVANCALSSGTRYCWGSGDHGILGEGSTDDLLEPTAPSSETIAWTKISLGAHATCGITASDLYCWGDNDLGQQGRGDHAGGPFLTPMETMTGAWTDVSVSFGGDSACAIAGGALSCWGSNSYDMLGQGPSAQLEYDAPTPVMSSVQTWSQVSVGGLHTCAISDGEQGLYCWGNNLGHEVGDPSVGIQAETPLRIGTDTWQKVSAGYFHTCGITTAGKLYCWGSNRHGVIGDGSQAEPRPVRTAR